jgi:DNA helicase-2/ATP-dependent DNA helicase PcrA
MLLTFTNKASREMLERVSLTLGTTAKGLWGGTFHHIGNRLLRKYGERIGIANNFTILDEEDSLTLLKNAISQSNPPSDKYFPKPRVVKSLFSLSANLFSLRHKSHKLFCPIHKIQKREAKSKIIWI